jgi:hypothetical protein
MHKHAGKLIKESYNLFLENKLKRGLSPLLLVYYTQEKGIRNFSVLCIKNKVYKK